MMLEVQDAMPATALQHSTKLLAVDVRLLAAMRPGDKAAGDAQAILDHLNVADVRTLAQRWDAEAERLEARASELAKARSVLTDLSLGWA